MRVVDAAGEIAKPLRNHEPYKLEEEFALAKCTAGIFIFSSKLGLSLGEATWSKFPAMCPYCLPKNVPEKARKARSGQALRPCRCAGRKNAPYDSARPVLKNLRDNHDLQPKLIDEWQSMFEGIYGAVHRNLPGDAIGYHLVEEIGEVAREVRRENFSKCKEEAADVFSWILSLANGTQRGLNRPVSVSSLLEESYIGDCNDCGKQLPCMCQW